MGDLLSMVVSYGIEVITPAVIDKPLESGPIELGLSIDATDALCECLEDWEPGWLVGWLGGTGYRWPSLGGFSLCNRFPKKPFPPDDCLDLPSCDAVGGMARDGVVDIGAGDLQRAERGPWQSSGGGSRWNALRGL
jgi:hypothetical protein